MQKFNHWGIAMATSPVERGFRIPPNHIDSWTTGEEMSKFKVAFGAGFPQLLLFGK